MFCTYTILLHIIIFFSDMSVEPGANTMEVLLENGFTQEQINKLIEQDIIENNQKAKL